MWEIAELMQRHTEYHAIFNDSNEFMHATFSANNLYDNPFLHLSMHLGLIEQVQMDRPSGIRACYQRLLQKSCDEHELQHKMMDLMAAHMWDAVHHQQPLDEQKLLAQIVMLESA